MIWCHFEWYLSECVKKHKNAKTNEIESGFFHANTPTNITPSVISEMPIRRLLSKHSLKIILPAITIDTILIAPRSTPWDSVSTDKKASHTTNSRQKQTIPIHKGIEENIAFQRASSLSASRMAACLSAICPTVSSVTLIIQMNRARWDNEILLTD